MNRRVFAVLALAIWCAPSWALAQEPAFSIRFVAGKSAFQPRERIEIELVPRPGSTFNVDVREGPGGWRGVDVVLDHATGVATPLRPLDAGFDPRRLAEPAAEQRLALNGWYRFDAPGRYRLVVRSKSNRQLESNPLTLEIAKRDPRWEDTTLARLVRTIDNPATSGRDVAAALADLRALGTSAAGSALARRYRSLEEWDVHDDLMLRGLLTVADRSLVASELRRELALPARRIDGWFIRALALIELAEAHPEGLPYSHDEFLRIVERESTSRAQAIAIGGGPGALEAEIARELGDLGRYEDHFLSGALAPALRNFPRESASAFRMIDIEPQLNILLWSWRRVAFPGMAPVLKSLYLSPAEEWAKLRDLALRRLFDLSPDEARPLLAAELERDELRVSTDTLSRLGNVTFPQLEPVWVRRLADGILDERLDGAVRLQHFGSSAVLADVRRLYDTGARSWSCEVKAAVVAYLVRVDAPSGLRTARDVLATSAGEAEDCHAAFSRTRALRPALSVARATSPTIVASGPLPGDESHLRFSIGEAVYDSPDALVAGLEQWPRGTAMSWTYESGTATTHLERWTLSERAAVFEYVRRAAAERGITIQ